MEKSLILNTKEEHKDQKLNELEANLHNLSLGNSSISNDFHYNNKTFIPKNNNRFNDNDPNRDDKIKYLILIFTFNVKDVTNINKKSKAKLSINTKSTYIVILSPK